MTPGAVDLRRRIAGVAGNDVAGPGGRAADRVARRAGGDQNAGLVRRGGRARRVRADVGILDNVARAFDQNSVLAEIADHQSLDHAPSGPGGQHQATRVAGVCAVQIDERRARVARLASRVDFDHRGDGGKRRYRRDRLGARVDVEFDREAARGGVGRFDRIPERAGAGVVGVDDNVRRDDIQVELSGALTGENARLLLISSPDSVAKLPVTEPKLMIGKLLPRTGVNPPSRVTSSAPLRVSWPVTLSWLNPLPGL